ncbi:hypothetical protein EK21DRAFT_119238 [Setomelanomma holmii]|uniref:Uncharacterized protein n=1 Tax=Setomelanomma holmii TaxID=210430 RepID=A0A9P4GWW7_9PLEO|nr:hypothetical protein EK21DRAFT_119238 [Setomelanomma holmii]
MPANAGVKSRASKPQPTNDLTKPMRMPGDLEDCPVLPSRNLADYPQFEGKPGRYRCLNTVSDFCGTSDCPWKHPKCLNGATLNELAKDVERTEGQKRSQIDRWVDQKRFSPAHKTWVGYYDEKLAKTYGKQKLVAEPLEWTEQPRKRAALRAKKANKPPAAAIVAAAQKAPTVPQTLAKNVAFSNAPMAHVPAPQVGFFGHPMMSGTPEQRSNAAGTYGPAPYSQQKSAYQNPVARPVSITTPPTQPSHTPKLTERTKELVRPHRPLKHEIEQGPQAEVLHPGPIPVTDVVANDNLHSRFGDEAEDDQAMSEEDLLNEFLKDDD